MCPAWGDCTRNINWVLNVQMSPDYDWNKFTIVKMELIDLWQVDTPCLSKASLQRGLVCTAAWLSALSYMPCMLCVMYVLCFQMCNVSNVLCVQYAVCPMCCVCNVQARQTLSGCWRSWAAQAELNQAWSALWLRETEKTCDRPIYPQTNFLFSPAALISVSEDISIPSVINVVKPSVVIPSVSVPSTSVWNPSSWGTWPFITISGISGE